MQLLCLPDVWETQAMYAIRDFTARSCLHGAMGYPLLTACLPAAVSRWLFGAIQNLLIDLDTPELVSSSGTGARFC
jgi:hypothetical protein